MKDKPKLIAEQRTKAFVAFLLEDTEESEQKKKDLPALAKKHEEETEETEASEEEHKDVSALERALDHIPQKYFKNINTVPEVIEAIMNAFYKRMNLPEEEVPELKKEVLRHLVRGMKSSSNR